MWARETRPVRPSEATHPLNPPAPDPAPPQIVFITKGRHAHPIQEKGKEWRSRGKEKPYGCSFPFAPAPGGAIVPAATAAH